jgi:hypothetical protein
MIFLSPLLAVPVHMHGRVPVSGFLIALAESVVVVIVAIFILWLVQKLFVRGLFTYIVSVIVGVFAVTVIVLIMFNLFSGR